MKYYNDELDRLKLGRKAVVRTKQNENRTSKTKYQHMKLRPDQQSQSPSSRPFVPTGSLPGSEERLSPHSFTYLSEQFASLGKKGLREINQPHGTQEKIELETLRILKENRQRFIKSTSNQTDFVASNYLSNMLAKEELHLKERFAVEKALKQKMKTPRTPAKSAFKQ